VLSRERNEEEDEEAVAVAGERRYLYNNRTSGRRAGGAFCSVGERVLLVTMALGFEECDPAGRPVPCPCLPGSLIKRGSRSRRSSREGRYSTDRPAVLTSPLSRIETGGGSIHLTYTTQSSRWSA
jgi:hypothetical protein